MQEYYRGQYEESVRSEKRAKKWIICSVISGTILIISTFVVGVLIQTVVRLVVNIGPTVPTGQ